MHVLLPSVGTAAMTVAGVVALALCALPLSADATARRLDEAEPAQIGQPHPALELDTLDGSLVNEGRVAGRPLIVEFFATWCEPCRRALSDMTALKRKDAAGAAIPLVLVSLGESTDVVRRWMANTDLPPATIVAVDPDGIAARRWGARRIPTTFAVDAAGVIRYINRGWGPGYRDRLLHWLRDIGAPAQPRSP